MTKKRLLAAACLLVLAPLASAQLYKYVDKNGKVVYSDTPPPSGDAKQINVPTGGGAPPPAPAPNSAAPKDAPKKDVADPRKAEDDARRAAAQAERCTRARKYLQTLTDGGRIITYNEKNERTFMDDNMIESERAKAQKAVDESCKA